MAGGDALDGRASDTAGGPTVGAELAGYRIEALVGRGGMGVVYRARDLALERDVALKLLAPELAADVLFRERFLRESRIAASLDHPGIVPIHDAGEVAGQLYIAMRLVEGTDLKRLLAAGPLDPERALALLEQVADSLDAAHERRLVHRDVKPSNVLVDVRGHCYLADFGLSRQLGEQAIAAAGARSLGTVDYAAPEQIRGKELDGRADLYSLGCLLYECLTGRPPYVRSSDTAVVFAHLEDEPPALPALPGLAPVIRKALAKDPDDRYQSGRELIEAARHALRPARPLRRRRLAALAVVVAGAGTAGGLLATQTGSTHSGPRQQTLPLMANALNLVDARTRGIVARVHGGHHAVSDLVFLGRSAWLSIPDERRLLRVDLVTKKVTESVTLPWTQNDRIAAGGGLVWVREARNLGTKVLGIDGRTGRIARRLDIGGSSIGIAFGAGSLWLVGGGDVIRVDPRTGETLHHFPANADLLVYGDGAIWVASADGSIWKIDPVADAIVVRARLHSSVSDLTIGGGSIWVSIVGEDKVYELSESDLGVQRALAAGPDPARIAVGGGTVWVANRLAGAVSRITESGIRTQFAAGPEPTALLIRDGVVWMSATPALPPLPPGTGEEIRISTPRRVFNTDPVSRVFPMDEQLSAATCANLLQYGRNGLEPEVAAAMPTVSSDGRTYTFRIRPGFRFSPPSNEPVTAETVRYTIERTLSPHAQNYPYYDPGIVGVDAYRDSVNAGRPAHVSGIRASGMTLSITLAKPDGDLPARLASPLFCPVPLSTPLDPKRVQGPVAGDGPYYFASVDGDRLVLLRNPNYGGNRPRRAARIVIRDDVPTPEAVELVARRQLDYLPNDFDGPRTLLGQQGELARLYGPGSAAARAGRQRFYLHTQPMFDMVVFNTRRPLFRKRRLRQAVEYALDRPAMAHAFWDRAASERIVQLPGYGPGDVYPLSGPDLRTARRLAGPGRRQAVLLMPCDFGPSAAAAVLRSNLARIGIGVRIVHDDGCDQTAVDAAFRKADMLIGAPFYGPGAARDPALFIEGVLQHGLRGTPLPPGPWSAPSFQRQLARAAPLLGRARADAYKRLDAELARYAPVVVYGSFLYTEYFSARVACQHFPRFRQGVDLGSLCVKGA